MSILVVAIICFVLYLVTSNLVVKSIDTPVWVFFWGSVVGMVQQVIYQIAFAVK